MFWKGKGMTRDGGPVVTEGQAFPDGMDVKPGGKPAGALI